MDADRKKKLLETLKKENEDNRQALENYLDTLVIKRNRTSLMMNSFMHNIVDVENSVETSQHFLKWSRSLPFECKLLTALVPV